MIGLRSLGIAAVLGFAVAGCSSSQTSGSGDSNANSNAQKSKSPDEQFADIRLEYNALTEAEKQGEKGKKLIADLKEIAPKLSDQAQAEAKKLVMGSMFQPIKPKIEGPDLPVPLPGDLPTEIPIPKLPNGKLPTLPFDPTKIPDLKLPLDPTKIPDLKLPLDPTKIPDLKLPPDPSKLPDLKLPFDPTKIPGLKLPNLPIDPSKLPEFPLIDPTKIPELKLPTPPSKSETPKPKKED